MITHCSVIGCPNHKVYNPDKIFYNYPTEKHKQLIWIKRTNPEFLNKIDKRTIKNHVICSDHFAESDHQTPEKKKLNRNALPSLNLPQFAFDQDDEMIQTVEAVVQNIVDIEPNNRGENCTKYPSIQRQRSASPEEFKVDPSLMFINLEPKINLNDVTLEDPIQTNPDLEIIQDELEITKPLILPNKSIQSKEIQKVVLNEDIKPVVNTLENVIDISVSIPTQEKPKQDQCRICFSSPNNLINIFQLDTDQINFYNKFRTSFIDLEMEDTINFCKICEKCCLNLRQVYNFKTLCQEGNERVQLISKATRLKQVTENDDTFDEPLQIGEENRLKEEVDGLPESEYMEIEEVAVENVVNEEIKVSDVVEKNANGTTSLNCSFCNYKFFNLDVLKRHMKIHLTTNVKSVIKLYKCPECPSKFLNVTSLMKHNRIVHKLTQKHDTTTITTDIPTVFKEWRGRPRSRTVSKCNECGKICSGPKTLRKHKEGHVKRLLRQMRGKELYLCELCGRTFRFNKNFQSHLMWHSGLKPYVCETCGRKFRTDTSLKNHMSIHSNVKPFICEVCGKAFRLKTMLTLHSRHHTGETPYICQVCDKRFHFSSSYKSHLRTHTGERPFKCSFENCTSDFIDKAHLNVHKNKVHLKKKEHFCTICPAGFYHAYNLKQHVQKHQTNETINTIPCDVCGKQFRHVILLKKHQRRHETAGMYACEECGKTFKQQQYVRLHMEKMHGHQRMENVPECLVCNRTFKSDYTLRIHMKIHETPKSKPEKPENDPEKTIPCNLCDKKFKNSSYLRIHLRSHTQDKPYRCTECGRCFSQSVGLKLHRFTHTGEKVYSCEMCNKKYRQAGHLQAHRNWHFGIKPHQCGVCMRQYSQKRDLRLHMEKVHGLIKVEVEESVESEVVVSQIDIEENVVDIEQRKQGLSLEPIE